MAHQKATPLPAGVPPVLTLADVQAWRAGRPAVTSPVVCRTDGIRMALGAERRDVLLMVLRGGATLAAGGLGAGFVASLALTRLLASLLFEVRPVDLATSAAVAATLAAVALAASYLPARRAARVDPMIALRYE